MKTYEEMKDEVFRRVDDFEAEKKRRRKLYIRAAAAVLPLCAAGGAVFALWCGGALSRDNGTQSGISFNAIAEVESFDVTCADDAPTEKMTMVTAVAVSGVDKPKEKTAENVTGASDSEVKPDTEKEADKDNNAPEEQADTEEKPTEAPKVTAAESPKATTKATTAARTTTAKRTTAPARTTTRAVETTQPNNSQQGTPMGVYTKLSVGYEEAKERFAHPIVQCFDSDFLGYNVGVVSQNGNISTDRAFCWDLTYEFANGQIYIQDQDRSAGKIANNGIEQYDYCGRTFVKEPNYGNGHIIIGYYPTDMDGLAYRAEFDSSVDMYEVMDRIISLEI